MSKELPQPKESEEVDLGQLFKLIGNTFQRFFNFIGSIFYHLFLAFVWLVFFVKRHVIKLVIAGILGISLGYTLEKITDPIYKSYMTIKQNYNTGENLYNSIAYYNDLVRQKDYVTLENVLGIKPEEASSILNFEVESVISENQKIKAYDDYIKTLDSVVASTIDYDTFIDNDMDNTHLYQQITIKAKERNSFKIVFENIINNIESNDYFKREKEKDINELTNRRETLKEALVISDSLRNTYKRVLEKDLGGKNASEIGITFEGNNDKDKTKEYDLYQSDLELRRELVEIEREIDDKRNIIEVVSSKQDSGIKDNRKNIFGTSVSLKVFFGIIFVMLTFLIFIGLDFVKFLERFRDKI